MNQKSKFIFWGTLPGSECIRLFKKRDQNPQLKKSIFAKLIFRLFPKTRPQILHLHVVQAIFITVFVTRGRHFGAQESV
jgi:hypothetical protein